MLSALDVAKQLGVSRGAIYDLAAPSGPIPCYRIGRRILFSDDDIQEYLEKRRYTKTTIDLRALSYSAVPLKRETSDLESYFRKLGVTPKLTPGVNTSKRGSKRTDLPKE